MKLTSSVVFAMIASLLQMSEAIPQPSILTMGSDGNLMVSLGLPGPRCVVDSSHCASWVYTDQSVSVLPGGYKFPWQKSFLGSLSAITYLDGNTASFYPGHVTQNLTIGGSTWITPALSGLHKTTLNITTVPPGTYSGSFGIGLGRRVQGKCCDSVVDAVSRTPGANPFTLLLSGSANGDYVPGWYSAALSDFNSTIFPTNSSINWRVLSTASGATVTRVVAIDFVTGIVTKEDGQEEGEKEDIVILDSIPTAHPDAGEDTTKAMDAIEAAEGNSINLGLPYPLRLFYGSNLVLNLKDHNSMFPYCIFEKLVAKLVLLGNPYTITDNGAGIYSLQVTNIPTQTIAFKLGNGESIVISTRYLFDPVTKKANFVGFKTEEMPRVQAQEIRQYGCDAILLGHAFLFNYALEHSVECPVSLKLRKFINA